MPDRLAVIQSEETIKELNLIDGKTKELVATFKILVEQTDKISAGFGKGTPAELIKAVNDAAAMQKKYEQALNDVSKATSELERLKKRITFASSEEGKQVAQLKLQLQDLNKENKEVAKSVMTLTGAYDALNREHEVARKKAMDAGVQYGIMSKQFLEAAKVANQYDSKLKQVDASLGKHNRNVGNYNNLQVQLSQVMREAPNFAIDPRIGIMSLTNNLPMLGDAIADVSRKSKEMKAEFMAAAAAAKEKAIADAIATGQSQKAAAALGAQAEAQILANYQSVKAPGLLKQIAGALFSWQTLLVVGIGLVMMYNKEIIAWTKTLFKGSEAAAAAAQNEKDLATMRQESIKSAMNEIAQLEILYRVATNEALSKEQRFRATDKLQKQYPSYFKNMSDEQIMLGQAISKYNMLKDAILASAKAQAGAKILSERMEKRFSEDDKWKDSYAKEILNLDRLRKMNVESILVGNQMIKVNDLINQSEQRLEIQRSQRFKKKVAERRSDAPLINAIATSEELAAPYEADKYGINPAKPKKVRDTSKADAARAKAERERLERERLEAMKREFERERDNIENLYKVRMDAVKNNIELAAKDPYSSETDKITNQMNHYSELIKLNGEYYDKLVENAKDYNSKVGAEQKVSITDIQIQRDTKAGEFSTNREALGLKTPEAMQKDLELSLQIEDSYRKAGYEEAKRLILTNKTLSVREREYQLLLLEQQQRLDLLNVQKTQDESDLELLKAKDKLTIDEQKRIGDLTETVATLGTEIENLNQTVEKTKLDKLREQLQPLSDLISAGFSSLGLDQTANEFDGFYKTILDKNATFGEKLKESMELVGAFASDLIQQQTEQRVAALDEQLKASQESTDQELGFIQGRLDMLNGLENATKEQISERNALEDEARTAREQQIQREKQIEKQKAKAQQRAAAQQAIINGLVAATTTLATLGIPAGIIPAAIAAAFGGIQAALIMSKDPVPQYFIGRKGGREEMAWTQERGREIITSKDGKIKSLGSDSGPTLTKLNAGDNVYTASETERLLADFENMPKVGDALFHKIAKQSISPIFIQKDNIDYDKLAGKVGDQFGMYLKKYDKEVTTEDPDGNMYKQKGGQHREFIGKKRVPKQSIEIKIKNKDVRD